MVVPNIAGKGNQARMAAARADIETNLASALDMYEVDNGIYPTTEQGLRALTRKPDTTPVPRSWNGPYLKRKKKPLDPWGGDYIYASPGSNNTESYDLSSYGADGIESEDDIVNWDAFCSIGAGKLGEVFVCWFVPHNISPSIWSSLFNMIISSCFSCKAMSSSSAHSILASRLLMRRNKFCNSSM